jgi:superfamily II DNA or RNA helicase
MHLSFDRGTIVLTESARFPARPVALPAYVRWDPRVRCLRAPAFRLLSLRSWLDANGVAHDCSCRRPRGFHLENNRLAALPPLRPYQEEALLEWRRAGRRGVIALPTGSGKTRVALHAALDPALSVLVLVPTRQLLAQWAASAGELYGGPIGIHGDGERTLAPLTLATYESAHRAMDRLGDRFDLLIVDEAHHIGAAEVAEACEMCAAPFRLGLTGTPPEAPEAAARLSLLLGPTCFQVPLASLTGTYLAAFEHRLVPLRLLEDELRRHTEAQARFRAFYSAFQRDSRGAEWVDFAREANRSAEGREALAALRTAQGIVERSRARLHAIDCLLDLHRADSKLVFTATNAAAYEVSSRFLVPAITCETERGERDEILRRFRDGVYRTIVSAKVLNEGFDVPAASVAIIAGGSSSPREQAQRLGRILRPVPGKTAVAYELVMLGTREWEVSERRSMHAAGVALEV